MLFLSILSFDERQRRDAPRLNEGELPKVLVSNDFSRSRLMLFS